MSKVFQPPYRYRELGNFGGGPVGCQKVTAFRLVSGLSQPILLFKYQVEASTQVSKHEPRHLGAIQSKQSTWTSQVCMHQRQPGAYISSAQTRASRARARTAQIRAQARAHADCYTRALTGSSPLCETALFLSHDLQQICSFLGGG